MIHIAEPPDVAACSECMSPLIWLYSFRTGRTFAAVTDPTNPASLLIHRCKPLQEPKTWRDLARHAEPHQVDVNRRGRTRVEEVLRQKTGEHPITEEEN